MLTASTLSHYTTYEKMKSTSPWTRVSPLGTDIPIRLEMIQNILATPVHRAKAPCNSIRVKNFPRSPMHALKINVDFFIDRVNA